MNRCIRRWLFVVGALLALPVLGHAQEAAVSGTLTDAIWNSAVNLAVKSGH